MRRRSSPLSTEKTSTIRKAPKKKKTTLTKTKSSSSSSILATSTPTKREQKHNLTVHEDLSDPIIERECQRLRKELERVRDEHQRQEEEIIALRALAKSLTLEVEQIQRFSTASSKDFSDDSRKRHEYFKMEYQLEQYEEHNKELKNCLVQAREQIKQLQDKIDSTLPHYQTMAVKAQSVLQNVQSQLKEEQLHSDKLREELAYYKARCHVKIDVAPKENVPVSTKKLRCERERFLAEKLTNQQPEDDALTGFDKEKDNFSIRVPHDLFQREFEALDQELLALHLSLDTPI
jgi:chromosome segregation ATPase